MPLFFILSGYLFRIENAADLSGYIKKLFLKLIIPYFSLCFINLLIQCFVSYKEITIERFLKYLFGVLYSIGTTEYLPNCSPLWFLTGLFSTLVVFCFLTKQFMGRIIWFVIVAHCLGLLLSKFKIILPWNLDIAMICISYLYFGFNLHKFSVIRSMLKLNFWNKVQVILFLIVISGIALMINRDNLIDFDARSYGNPIALFIGSVAIVVMIFCLTNEYKIIGENNFLCSIGRHTMFLMGFDYFSGSTARVVCRYMLQQQWIYIFSVKLIIIFSMLSCWFFLQKFLVKEHN